MFRHFAFGFHFAKFLKFFAAMQLLMLTGLLQFAPPGRGASDALVLSGGAGGGGVVGVGALPLNENLAQLNRHQLRQFHTNLLARLDEGGGADADAPLGASRERRSLANGRWGLRPGKRSAGLIAVDRPGAFGDESAAAAPPSGAANAPRASDSDEFRGFDLHPLLISAPIIAAPPLRADDGALESAPTYAPPRFANFRFFMMPPF